MGEIESGEAREARAKMGNMTARFGGQTYVASVSLDDRLQRTEDAINRLVLLIQVVICMTALVLIGVLGAAYLKRDLILALLFSLY